ncbi:MAG TPA: hypothetical protein VJZ00_06930 [Thermoanaerobaculia bacterium]|nr:hypothetical protein [Thermoanaerobaculia bacterium]
MNAIPMDTIRTRPTAPFAIFHRTLSGEGGFSCETCGVRRHGTFPRAADVFAVAAQHLGLCRGAVRNRPIEGTAILDGATHGVVLRDAVMILALPTVFATGRSAMRVVA